MGRLIWATLMVCGSIAAQVPAEGTWKFAVSGDSRNCGDIVMPAIAAGVLQSGAAFYWHLGDFRAIYKFDEDLVPPSELGLSTKPLNIADYLNSAWPDFIAHQIVPFGSLPVFLAMGNHETIPPATRQQYIAQFADWLENPLLKAQRLADNPSDHLLRSYYHWAARGVDVITLDNASADQFDNAQLKWFHSVVARDEASPLIRTIVVGMHAALPGSIGHSHSMEDSAQGQQSGRDVYETLWHAHSAAHKQVYVIASHSHFYMEDVYRTDTWKDKVLPGWIVGTAGAVRYPLPDGVKPGPSAMTNVYGYLVGTVSPEGAVSFAFQKTSLDDLLHANQGKFPEALIRWCYDKNP